MVDSDIEDLRNFGQKVQKQKIQSSDTKLFSFFNKINIFYIFKKVFRLVWRKICSFTSSFMSRLKKGIHLLSMFFNEKRRNKQLLKNNYGVKRKKRNESNTVLVDYHKQWRNFSIIIRRRKKQVTHVDLASQVSSSNTLCYYFQQVDSKENHYKMRYKPKNSIWDFPFYSNNSFLSQIKNYFFRRY